MENGWRKRERRKGEREKPSLGTEPGNSDQIGEETLLKWKTVLKKCLRREGEIVVS